MPGDPAEHHIVLIGPRGSGKSTAGRLLARRLGVPLVDLDAEVARAAGRSIAEIFAAEGEPGFRARESAALAAALTANGNGPGVVIAAGGGVVVREANRALLKAAARHRVFLNGDPAELWRRIAADPATAASRPALTAEVGEAEVRRVLAARLPLYRELATLELDVTRRTPDQVADAILQAVAGPP